MGSIFLTRTHMASILIGRVIVFVSAFGLWSSTAAAQAPPAEMDPLVLIDSGPAQVPRTCDCITSPFTVPVGRPPSGGSGPAAPYQDPELTPALRRNLRRMAAKDRAEVPGLIEQAIGGNDAASLGLGLLFTAGTVYPRDDKQAARWFNLAARQGNTDALLQLGYRYSRGVGVRQNDKTAAYWYRQGALRGDKAAMVALGLLYAAGRGVKQDWVSAVGWWEYAGEGAPAASRFLGDAYACGLGVPQDHAQALSHYTRAGDVSSLVQLAHMHRLGCVEANDDAAFAAYQKASDLGDPEAQVGLSDMYLAGRGTHQSPYHAYMWARIAELRLPPGELRTSANHRVTDAARLLTAFEIKDVEKFAQDVISLRTSSPPK